MTPAEADEQLAQAIRNHAIAYDLTHHDALLADYAIIANWQPIQQDDTARYTLHFADPNTVSHIARGLFVTALELINRALE